MGLSQTELLLELEQVVEDNLNRHLAVAKEWFPHEYVPWSEGRNFDGVLDGDAWSPDDSPMSDVARSALIVNLLTEDNLPSYHHEIAVLFGRDAAWGEWVHRWTAEEGRHGAAIRDYLLVKRAVDPVDLERARMNHMSAGLRQRQPREPAPLARVRVVPGARDPGLAPQHRPGHRGPDVRPAAGPDRRRREPAHDLLPQPAVGGASSWSPTRRCGRSPTSSPRSRCRAPTSQGFQRKAVEMAVAGVYDLRQHRDDVVMPVLRFWKVFDIEGLGAEGEPARSELVAFLDQLDVQATRFEDKRDTLKARMADRLG